MREFHVLNNYHKGTKRVANRTIRNRIIASSRDKHFFDGDRENGYGGFAYDGRWEPIARMMCEEYKLDDKAGVLQINCEKGFLLHEFLKLHPCMRVRGTETSVYARNTGMPDIRLGIRLEPPTAIPFDRKEFDLVIALGVVYTLNLPDAIRCLREISRVGKQSFVTLGAYDEDEDYKLMRSWSLLGTTILRKDEWIEVLEHVNYHGDYQFITSKDLGLCAS